VACQSKAPQTIAPGSCIVGDDRQDEEATIGTKTKEMKVRRGEYSGRRIKKARAKTRVYSDRAQLYSEKAQI
jgi:hypothetical protein